MADEFNFELVDDVAVGDSGEFNFELADFTAEEALAPSQQEETNDNRLARGVDILQATLGSSILASGELLGNQEFIDKGREIRDRNYAEADQEAPASDNILETLAEAVPSIGGVLAAGGTGLAVGGPVGGLIGIGLGSFGLNLGTVRDIQEQLDPEATANLTTLLGAGSATAVDVLGGAVFTKAAAAPLKEAAKRSLMKEFGKGVVVGGATGLTGQGILETSGTIAADAEFDEDRIDAIAHNTAMAGLIGAGIGGSASSGVSVLLKMRQMQDDWDIRQTQNKADRDDVILVDKDGDARRPEAPNPVVYEEPGLLKRGIVKLGGRAISPINHLRQFPAFDNLISKIDQSRTERRGNKQNTHSNESELIKGENRQPIDELNTLSRERQNAIGNEIAIDGATSGVALRVKDMLKKVREQAVSAGIKMGDLGDTYLPFSPSMTKIKANSHKFRTEILENARTKLNDKEYAAFKANFDEYTNNLLTEGGRSFGADIQSSKAKELIAKLEGGTAKEKKAALKQAKAISKGGDGLKVSKNNPLEMERFLKDIDQDVLERWTVDAPLANRLNDYLNLAAERIAFAKLFGANGEKIHRDVFKGILEAKAAGKSVKMSDIDRAYNIVNAMQRKYKADKMSPETRAIVDKVRAFQYLRTLPLATIASLVEPFIVLEGIGVKGGVTGLGKAIMDTAGRIGKKVGMNKGIDDGQRFASDVNVSYMNALSDTAQRLDADAINMSKLESGIFKWNGLAAWTEFNRLFAAHSAENAITRTIQQLADGPKTSKDANKLFKKLEEAGIDPSTALDWYRKGGSKSDPAYREIRKGIVNLVNDVVVKPDASNRPLWMSDPRLQLVAQLKGWPTVFTSKVMTRWVNRIVDNGMVGSFEEGAKLATFMAIYVAGLHTQTALKDVIKDGELNTTGEDLGSDVASALSQVGGFGFAIDPIRGASYGASATAALGGPTVSYGDSLIKAVGGVLFGEKTPESALGDIINASMPNVVGQGAAKEVVKEAFK